MRRGGALRSSLMLIPFILLIGFLVYPVAIVLIQGLLQPTGSSFQEVVGSSLTQRIILFTVGQALVSTMVAMVLGVPGAFVLTKLQFRGKNTTRALMTVPFILPPIVVVVGFLEVFGPGGIIDSILMALLGSDTSMFNIATGYIGIILAHAFYNAPLFILMVSASLERLNPDIEEMAQIHGATFTQRLRRIIVPHIRISILAASILTFLFSFMSFPIVLALGEGSFMTIEVQIWNAFRFFDYGEAASLAIIQLLITMTLAYAYIRTGVREREVTGRTSYVRTVNIADLSTPTKILLIVYSSILLILLVGPILAIIRSAVYDPNTHVLTLRGFESLLNPGMDGGLIPMVNSLFYASLATVFSVILGLLLVFSQQSKMRLIPDLTSMVTLLPLGVSAITIAYGLMIAIAVPLGLSTNPWPLIVVAQTLIGVPFSVRAIEITRSKIDPAILEQAESLGASALHRVFFVELPLLAPGILVAGFFSFAMAIGEMSATIFLARPENFTLAIIIYRYLSVRKFVEAGAASLFLVVMCVAAFIIMERISENGYGGTV